MKDGLYESVVDESLKEELDSEDLVNKRRIVPIDKWQVPSQTILSSYIQSILNEKLNSFRDDDPKAIQKEIAICNDIIEKLAISTNDDKLREKKIILNKENLLVSISKDEENDIESHRPKSPMSVSSIFTGKSSNIPLYEELKREIYTSNEVLFLVSFIRMSGLMQIIKSLEDFTKNGGKLRILTTTYMGVTEIDAINRLSELNNTEIRISYDSHSTRLHAKAYVFKRDTGLNTAFIGSSNLSKAAMNDGMEWNVKLTSRDVPGIIDSIFHLYDQYWNSGDFKPYNPNRDKEELEKALKSKTKEERDSIITLFDLKPYPFQNQVLEQLQAEREIRKQYRNLVVSATGTGKTMIAAFDYRNYSNGKKPNLLFVAHRENIINKSMKRFQAVLKDPNFGIECGGGYGHRRGPHIFITIQTLNSMGIEELCNNDPYYYEYIVIDEVHHGTANSYRPIFDYCKPKILLGLTATPERMNGEDIAEDFGNHMACEIRLPEAIDRELLVPFHYYGLTDIADISSVRYENGQLRKSDLDSIYIGNTRRADLIVESVKKYKPDKTKIKGLAFCVSVEHAEFMCKYFNDSGYKAKCITGRNSFECNDVNNELNNGDIQFIFSVNVYNEGIDIPSVNLVLFLRPTESLTIFIQQLGRGLRLSEGKTELTVLDFVGQADQRYKVYNRKLEYLSIMSTQPLKDKITNGFTGLPVGCSIELEEKTQEYILKNIEKAIGTKGMIKKLKEMYHNSGHLPTLEEFVNMYEIDLSDLYKGDNTFTGMCKIVLGQSIQDDSLEKQFTKGLRKLSLIDSYSWISNLKEILNNNNPISDDDCYALMLYYTFNSDSKIKQFSSLNEFISFLRYSEYLDEILSILKIKNNSINYIELDSGLDIPLKVYSSYTQEQILAGLGLSTFSKECELREGVRYLEKQDLDVFLITLNKNEKEYSANTMYNDYVINEKLFHWESQNKTTPDKGVGKRYIDKTRQLRTLLFVREYKKQNGQTAPYVFLGRGNYKQHEGSKPMKVVWEMEKEIPPSLIECSTRV